MTLEKARQRQAEIVIELVRRLDGVADLVQELEAIQNSVIRAAKTGEDSVLDVGVLGRLSTRIVQQAKERFDV